MHISALLPVSVSLFFATAAFSDVTRGIELLNTGDVSAAATEFAAAYEAGDGEGAFYLGRLFELGLGIEKDEMRAANLYSAAADTGSTKAQARLGLMYHEGRVLLRDYAEGTRLICAAADAGDADGQLNCGMAYRLGRGVEVNLDLADTYLQQSAAQNNILALNILGQNALEIGDNALARQYLSKSADMGNAGGMFEYAKLLAAELSPDNPDNIAAYGYASLAVVRGLSEASAFRDRLEATMTAEDILAAQVFAREWTEARMLEGVDQTSGN